MRMMERAKAVMKRILSLLSWKRDSIKIRQTIKQSIDKRSSIEYSVCFSKILILAPHSDDEWIGCYSLLEHYNCVIASMDMEGGNDAATRDLRFKEMENVGAKYNFPVFRIVGDKVESLNRIISREKPSHIAVPFFIDWHEEHIETMSILKNALCDNKCDIITYQVSCPLPTDAVNYYMSLSRRDWKRKWKFFKDNYKTQKGFPWKRFALIEKAEGGYNDSFACNVFSVFEQKVWLDSFYLLMNCAEKQEAMKLLGTVCENFSFLNSIYLEKSTKKGQKDHIDE